MTEATPRPFDIFMVRGKRVILDSDPFLEDFAFRLLSDEWEALRSQIATLETKRIRRLVAALLSIRNMRILT